MPSESVPQTGKHVDRDAYGFGATSLGGSISCPRSARAPSERVLLIRSGRHLRVAIDALRERFPDCQIAVVGTPGSEPVIEQAGIAPADIFTYGAKPRFTPVAFAGSRAARAARRWGFTRVAVLWNDPDGRGQGNVDRTAFVLAPRGFLAITPDGSVVERSPVRQLTYETRRALVSLAAGVVLGALYLPAVVVAAVRRVLPVTNVGRVSRSAPAAPIVADTEERGRRAPGALPPSPRLQRTGRDTRPTYPGRAA